MAGLGEGRTIDSEGANELASPEVVDGEIADEATSRDTGPGIIRIEAAFSGPLPPPEILVRYNDALPDGADRIVKLAEAQSRHRRSMESRGQLFAFTLALVAILAGVALILDGKSAEGLVPLIGAIGGLAGVFVYGEVRAHKARQIDSGEEGDPPGAS